MIYQLDSINDIKQENRIEQSSLVSSNPIQSKFKSQKEETSERTLKESEWSSALDEYTYCTDVICHCIVLYCI